ncbi:acyl-CoA-binding domain-containing protein 3-like [Pyrus x bretschneideri]|uniref:acyl-CoA-binding domain-containing protein 3-like n=1 Tax=Pyrus x bretschneideri TaxID=225117 RepID=UPI00202FCFE3|nr:acyl-CoA-binding domain-containing protein 3-like [Pyrus x bretschneideri]
MELVQDLFLTASLALILSFLVAKLVAMAVAGRESEAEFGERGDAGGERVGAEEVSFEERRLKVEGAFRCQSQRSVDFVGELNVVRFEGETVHRAEEIAEPLQDRRKGRGLPEEVLEEESVEVRLPEKSLGAVGLPEKSSAAVGLPEKSSAAVGLPEKSSAAVGLPEKSSAAVGLPEKSSAAVGLPEKSSDGGDKLSVEKAIEFDRGSSDNSEVEEIGAKSAGNEVVADQSEEVRVADSDEAKEKTHVAASEFKSGNFSDEDDWEGIEKSELDDEYAAAVRSEGHD